MISMIKFMKLVMRSCWWLYIEDNILMNIMNMALCIIAILLQSQRQIDDRCVNDELQKRCKWIAKNITYKFRPIPIASEAIRMFCSQFGSLNFLACSSLIAENYWYTLFFKVNKCCIEDHKARFSLEVMKTQFDINDFEDIIKVENCNKM